MMGIERIMVIKDRCIGDDSKWKYNLHLFKLINGDNEDDEMMLISWRWWNDDDVVVNNNDDDDDDDDAKKDVCS
jgi:hypothetical protein